MIILYGYNKHIIDVTEICLTKLRKEDYIYIPSGDDKRSFYFSDPIVNTVKKIYIINNNQVTEYNEYQDICIKLSIEIKDIVNEKLQMYHNRLKLYYGSFMQELPEQKMVVRYLTGDEKILEIGGNIGRNSLIIGSILKEKNNNNFVTMETDPSIAYQLQINRNSNNLTFHIENAGLSKRNLIQKEWITKISDELLDGYIKVPTITLEELNKKYNIEFDTLVLDCEGAFYYILQDMPEILNNIKLIIMENDYTDITHKEYVDNILKQRGFKAIYKEKGGWGPCENFFFEVWKKE